MALLQRWVIAVANHHPGATDRATAEFNRLTLEQLQFLWIDVNSLSRIMRNHGIAQITVTASDGGMMTIRYSGEQMRTLLILACVGGGYLDPNGVTMGSLARDCTQHVTPNSLAPALRETATAMGAARRRKGDDNLLWRLAALFHSDIAMLEPTAHVAPDAPTVPGAPRRTRIELRDGRAVSLVLEGVHWQLAETAIGFLQPSDANKPAPERDGMVRDWYRATATWLQKEERHDVAHLTEGHRLFPGDAQLVFLFGCEHEAIAAPVIQAALSTSRREPGLPAMARDEWRTAEGLLQESLRMNPAHGEARLHHGRVLSLLGRNDDAVRDLEGALDLLQEPLERYYGHMFLGYAEEARGHYDMALRAYTQARDEAPGAQSPYLALSQLAHRRDAVSDAARVMRDMFAETSGVDDPWWTYYVAHARRADEDIAAVWADVARLR